MVSNWSENRRRTNGGQVHDALEQYVAARQRLAAVTHELHQAEQRGDPPEVIAVAARLVQAATANERQAYVRAIELLDTKVTEPDPVPGQPPAT